MEEVSVGKSVVGCEREEADEEGRESGSSVVIIAGVGEVVDCFVCFGIK